MVVGRAYAADGVGAGCVVAGRAGVALAAGHTCAILDAVVDLADAGAILHHPTIDRGDLTYNTLGVRAPQHSAAKSEKTFSSFVSIEKHDT